MPGGGYEDGPDFVPNAMPSVVSGPPLEEHLAQVGVPLGLCGGGWVEGLACTGIISVMFVTAIA
jgi:hypothetical protein